MGVSEELLHAAPTTVAFLKLTVLEFRSWVESEGQEFMGMHTDSPCSQNRNRSIVKLMSRTTEILGCPVLSWDYWEAGHGKGPSDGVGVSVKRSADLAIKTGKHISCAVVFFQWADECITTC